jgi:outer membrane protein TolC
VLGLTPLALLVALAPAPAGGGADRPAPGGTGEPRAAEPSPTSGDPLAPTPTDPAAPATTRIEPKTTIQLEADYLPPFPSEDLELSEVLKSSINENLALRGNLVDVEINEARVMAALGAYDVFLLAGVNASVSETPRRGSQIVFLTGSRTLGGNVGFRRKLETGGTIQLQFNFNRRVDNQLNPFNPSVGAFSLSQYVVQPSLTINQPLLQNAGLRVNRADINKAKIAVTQAEALRLVNAQNLVRDIVSSYWDVLFAHRDLANKRRSVELAKQQLDRTNALVAAGRQSPVEAKAVEQALAARESDVLTAENALLDRSLTLRQHMGQEFASRKVLGVLPATDPEVVPREINTQAEIDRALAQNPQLRQLELALASGRIDELVAANRRLPLLDFSASFTPQGRSIDTIPDPSTGSPGTQASWAEAFKNMFNDDPIADGLLADWTLTGALTLTWDVQNRGPKGNHEVARLNIKKAEINLATSRQQITTGIIRAAYSVRTTAKVMDTAQVSLDLSLQNLAAEQARFEVGRSTNFDVLLRLDEVDKAQAAALSAQVAYLKALVQLQALNGEILPAYGLDLS